MKKLITYLLSTIMSFTYHITSGQNPVPDFTFGNNGIVLTEIAGADDVANDIITQPDGKYIVAGNGVVASHNQFMIIRYHVNGDIDSTFGVNGKATLILSPTHNYARALALQQDGKIVVAGYYDFNFDDRAVVARYDSTGNLDGTFGNGGIVQFSVTTDFDGFNSVVIQSDGKILVAGRKYTGNNYNFYVMRLNTDGVADNSFGNNGRVETDFQGHQDYIYSILIQPDGKILVAGASGPGSSYFAAARYLSNGNPDITFGNGGKVLIGSGSRLDICTGLGLNDDGSIILAGNHHDNTIDEYMFVKLDTNGVPDPAFGINGIQLLPTSHPANLIRDIAIRDDGKIIACGSGNGQQAVIIRLNPNGFIDNSFGSQGIFTCGASTSNSALNSILLLGDSAIIGCGFSELGVNDQYLLVKVLMPGTTGISEGSDSGQQILIYPNPASEYFYVTTTTVQNKELNITLLDSSGRIVLQEKAAPGKMASRMNLSHGLKSGNYFIRVESEGADNIKQLLINK